MIEGGYGTTVGETGPEEPGLSTVPHEHAMGDVDPVRELPYGLAALIMTLHQRPDRWQHPTSVSDQLKKSLALQGASTDGKLT